MNNNNKMKKKTFYIMQIKIRIIEDLFYFQDSTKTTNTNISRISVHERSDVMSKLYYNKVLNAWLAHFFFFIFFTQSILNKISIYSVTVYCRVYTRMYTNMCLNIRIGAFM